MDILLSLESTLIAIITATCGLSWKFPTVYKRIISPAVISFFTFSIFFGLIWNFSIYKSISYTNVEFEPMFLFGNQMGQKQPGVTYIARTDGMGPDERTKEQIDADLEEIRAEFENDPLSGPTLFGVTSARNSEGINDVHKTLSLTKNAIKDKMIENYISNQFFYMSIIIIIFSLVLSGLKEYLISLENKLKNQ